MLYVPRPARKLYQGVVNELCRATLNLGMRPTISPIAIRKLPIRDTCRQN